MENAGYRKYSVHNRTPSIDGKSMPVSELVINLSPTRNNYESLSTDGYSPTSDLPPMSLNADFCCDLIKDEHSSQEPIGAVNKFSICTNLDHINGVDGEQTSWLYRKYFLSNTHSMTIVPSDSFHNFMNDDLKKNSTPATFSGRNSPVDTRHMGEINRNDLRSKFLSTMFSNECDAGNYIPPPNTPIGGYNSTNTYQLDLMTVQEKLSIAEAIDKTSRLTSPAAVRRLAARKQDYDEYLKTFTDIVDVNCGVVNGRNIYDDTFIIPRDILNYLVRMGSFNSTPKFENNDTLDNNIDLRENMSLEELKCYCESKRHNYDENSIFQRPFLKNSHGLDDVDSRNGTDYLRIFQWNILSQSLGQSADSFVECPAEALEWDYRKYLLVQEIIQHNPDIICLQEVDHFKFLQHMLGTQNYKGIFFPKPDSPCLYIVDNNGPDGCAIFFKIDKFELIDIHTRVLEVWKVQSNQVAIVLNLRVISTGIEISVCSTHLKAKTGALLAKLRNEQGKDLLKFVEMVAANRPIIICGDFNAEPCEPIYKTILDYKSLFLVSAYSTILTECQSDDDKTNICQEKNIVNEPPYTTWKIREDGEVCHTIDYIFYASDKIRVNDCLSIPNEVEIGYKRIPSYRYPSDHFSLLCDVQILASSS